MAHATQQTSAAPGHLMTEWYRDRFEEFEKRLDGERTTPVHALRRKGLERFIALGFPTTRMEEWRFTNITPLLRTAFHPAVQAPSPAEVPPELRPSEILRHGVAATVLVFVNGHWSAELSLVPELPAGVRVLSLAQALKTEPSLVHRYLARHLPVDENAFTALNAAFMQDGAVVMLPERGELPGPVHLAFITTAEKAPVLSQPRTLIVAGAGSRLSLVETHTGPASGAYFANPITEMIVGENAIVEHDRLQMDGADAFHIGTVHMSLASGSMCTSTSLTLGGSLVRNNVTALFGGEGGVCTLNGLTVGARAQLLDNHTTIDHAMPRCASHELYKAILDGTARGAFNGKIFVRQDAQRTDAKQTNKTLLLSDAAVINTKPQLEIFADDVKCTHGATVGQLDDEQIFYLRSRGIGVEEARDMLTLAFADDVIQRIGLEPLRDHLEQMLHQRLRQGRVAEG